MARDSRPERQASIPARSADRRPETLPAGHHHLEPSAVHGHQRTRLIGAVSALCAERGFANIVISDVVRRAAVSKSTFYRFYETKEDCLLDAHKLHSAALLAAVDARRRETTDPYDCLRAGTAAALSYCQENREAAYMLGFGILSSGPRGLERHRVMIEALAKRLPLPLIGEESRRTMAILAAAAFLSPLLMPQAAAPDPGELGSLDPELVELILFFSERR
jgi:AcrR family transcriptional regulator